jgi:hypothetical protein
VLPEGRAIRADEEIFRCLAGAGGGGGDLSSITTVLGGVHLRGGIATWEMLVSCGRRIKTMSLNNTGFLELVDGITGGELSALWETIESQAGKIESLEGTVKSLAEENERRMADAVLVLYGYNKSPEEISKSMKLDLSEVYRLLGNGLR